MVQKINTGDISGVSVVGFRINPNSDKPDLYSLFTYGAKEIPLMSNKEILFFSSPELADVAYKYFDENIKELLPSPTLNLDAVCDVAGMLYVLNNQDVDDSAIIINCLNIIFDLVTATQISMPKNYKKILYNFADHLTFNQEFSTYLSEKKLKRKDIMSAILWCIGAVVVSSKIMSTIPQTS